jgi:hypothetical protein
MSLTLTPVRNGEDIWGRSRTTLYDITLDASYPLTDGYVINAQDIGLKSFLSARVEGGNQASGAVLPVFDFGTPAGVPATSAALRLFLPTGGAAAPATLVAPAAAITEGAITNGAISIAASTADVDAGGTPVTSTSAAPSIPITFGAITQAASSIAAGSSALTAGIGLEVGDTTDVSSIIIRVRFIGF